jgi:DNA mismatch repair ATPase MutS
MDEKIALIRKENLMKYTMWFFFGLTGIIAYFSLILGEQQGKEYYAGLGFIVFLLPTALYFRKIMLKYRAVYYVKDSYPKEITRKRNFKDIKKLHELLKAQDKESFFIDNQTYEDLTMDKVFAKLDRTLSAAGEQVLYHMLRAPEFIKEVLDRRNELISYFQGNKEIREKIQVELYSLSRQQQNTIAEFLWGEEIKPDNNRYIFIILSSLPIVFALLVPFYGFSMLAYIIPVFIANMFIHTRFNKKTNLHINSMAYLSAVVNTARNLAGIKDAVIESDIELLEKNTKNIKASRRAGVVGTMENIDAVMDYVNILFLVKERKYYAVLKEMSKYKKELREVYLKVGELDALISIASYRESIDYYTVPELSSANKNIEAVGLVHPLIEEPIANSINMNNKGIILTGSNMSGKSTFLRTVGINALFAQTICTTLAKQYKGSFFKILSSISPSDDILQGKSYYLGEAEAVLRIIRNCRGEVPLLCIIDEIFRGTNPIERISASCEILNYLISNNSLPIVATHDLELTEHVDEKYECYYFTEDVDDEGLRFDYLIRKGVSPTRNAIKLLKFLGYPEEIIESTYKRIDDLFGA